MSQYDLYDPNLDPSFVFNPPDTVPDLKPVEKVVQTHVGSGACYVCGYGYHPNTQVVYIYCARVVMQVHPDCYRAATSKPRMY